LHQPFEVVATAIACWHPRRQRKKATKGGNKRQKRLSGKGAWQQEGHITKVGVAGRSQIPWRRKKAPVVNYCGKKEREGDQRDKRRPSSFRKGGLEKKRKWAFQREPSKNQTKENKGRNPVVACCEGGEGLLHHPLFGEKSGKSDPKTSKGGSHHFLLGTRIGNHQPAARKKKLPHQS